MTHVTDTPQNPTAGADIAPEQFTARLQEENPHLRRYALSLTRDPADADDLVQDCLVRALKKRHQFTPGTHVRRWLFTIMRNINIDNQRQRSRRGPHVEISEVQSATHQPPAQEDRIELMEVVQRLDEVRDCDREVFMLSVFGGLSQDEIASRMGIAVGTVKSRLSRTRQALSE